MNENEKLNETMHDAAEEITETEETSIEESGENTQVKEDKKQQKPGKPEKSSSERKKPMSRKMKHSLISAVSCILVIAAVVLINFISYVMTDKFPGMTADITSKRSFEISDQSVNIAQKINKKVDITFLTDKTSYINIDPYCKQTAYLAEEMERRSDGMIKVNYTDIVRNPSFVDKYPDEDLNTTDIIVSCGDSYRLLTVSDLFTFASYSDSYKYIASSHSEQSIDNAIVSVTNEQVTNVVVLTDYTSEDYSYFVKTLTSNGYTVKEMSIKDNDIPSNTDLLVVYAPTQDYTKEETDKLRKYLDNDGKYKKNMLFLSESKDVDIPNLDGLLLEYSIELEHGFVFEADSTKINSSSSNYFDGVLCNYYSELYRDPENKDERPVITGYTKPVSIINANYCIPLLSFSDYSGICPFDADENWNISDAITGKTIVLAQGTKGTETDYSNLIVSGTYKIFSKSYYGSDYGNQLYLSTMLASITGRDTSRVTVADKVITEFDLDIDRQTAVNLGFVVYAFIPIVILGTGFAVFLLRRNR